MSVYAFLKKLSERKGFRMTPKNRKFSTFSSFRRMSLEASFEYLRSFRSVQDVFLCRLFEFSSSKKKFEKVDFSMFACQILKSFSLFSMKFSTIECCTAAMSSQFGDEI